MDNFYDILADCYDSWQKDNDPSEWASYINTIINKYGPKTGDGENNSLILVDLGCGTGKVTAKLYDMGYDAIGIDSSYMMLNKAMDLSYEEGKQILWLNQDITEYELYGTADVFISLLDTVNHLSGIENLEKIFVSFKNYMNPDGIFIFDVGTERHFAKTLANNVFFVDEENYTLLWVNHYNPDERVNKAEITLFENENSEDELYSRYDGTITEKFITEEEIMEAARKNGLCIKAILGNMSEDAPKEDDERIFYVIGKEKQ
ncbi:MAG: class I SAM-dependent methyltransferase [Clostridia bacterium]|nr:class I SAM-dependent methyltransferase [Clostridia bacterium]